MKLSENTKYYAISLETAERLLLSTIELLQETYEEELHEYATLSPYVRTETSVGRDLFAEIEFLNGLINELKNSRNELKRILPQRSAE